VGPWAPSSRRKFDQGACLPTSEPWKSKNPCRQRNREGIRRALPTGEDLFREDEVFQWGWSACHPGSSPSFRRMFFVVEGPAQFRVFTAADLLAQYVYAPGSAPGQDAMLLVPRPSQAQQHEKVQQRLVGERNPEDLAPENGWPSPSSRSPSCVGSKRLEVFD